MSNSRQTEDAFHQGWLRTGDICRIDADGFISIMGRAKDVIIRGGHNIDPRTIEDAALGFPGVGLAAAVGRPDTYAGEVPMLFVSPQPGVIIDQQALADYVQEKIMEPPARPRAVAIIADMPVTAVGKIFKPKLREIAARAAARELLKAAGLFGRRECRGCHRSLAGPLSARGGARRQGGGGEASAAAVPGQGRTRRLAPAASGLWPQPGG